jgi:hypothetical protein
MSQYSLKITEQDYQDKVELQRKILEASNFFRMNGYLYIDDIIPTEQVDEVYHCLIKGLQYNKDKTEITNALEVGHRRYMIPVTVEDEINKPLIYGNPILISLMRKLLGSSFVIDSFGAVAALPGSEPQHMHRDSPTVYEDYPFLAESLPPYAITVTVPLVDITLENGPTLLREGSHRIQGKAPFVEKAIPSKKGSIVIWDYRIVHGGSANLSEAIRPLLYLVYTRPWFQDHVNFSKEIIPVNMPEDTFNALPEQYQKLFRSSINTHW